jgi:hypothetical protein
MLRDAPVIYDQGERIVDLLMDDLHTRKMLRPEDFGRPHWHLEPADQAAQARALYVRQAAPTAAVARMAPTPAPLFGPDPRKIRDDSLRLAQLRADSAANRPVTSLSLPLTRGEAGGAMGALVADAYRTALRTDLGLVGTTELTSDIGAGTLTVGELNAAWPDHSPLQRLTLNGAATMAVLEQLVSGGTPSAAISGVTVTFDPKRPSGSRIRNAVLPSGKKLSRGASYTLAMSGALLSQLNLTAQEAPATTTTFDAVNGYLRLLPSPVTPPVGPRITVAP